MNNYRPDAASARVPEHAARDFVTVLRARTPAMRKQWALDGSKPTIGSKALWFTAEEVAVNSLDDLHALLEQLKHDGRACIVRGRLRSDWRHIQAASLPAWSTEYEAKNGKPLPAQPSPEHLLRRAALFEDAPHRWMMLDVDGFACSSDPIQSPSAALCEYIDGVLPRAFAERDHAWQLSGSAGHATAKGGLCAHLWFWLNTPRTGAELNAWGESINATWKASGKNLLKPDGKPFSPVDTAVFRPVQLHYIAAPVMDPGVVDPVVERTGFFAGLNDAEVPDLEVAPAIARPAVARCDMVDPRSKPGVFGAFHRAFTLEHVLASFIPGQFEQVTQDRLTWLDGGGAPEGVFVGEQRMRLGASHNSWPWGVNGTAVLWDLVRQFKFGHLDEGLSGAVDQPDRPSNDAMVDWAKDLPEVQAELDAGDAQRRDQAAEAARRFLGSLELADGACSVAQTEEATALIAAAQLSAIEQEALLARLKKVSGSSMGALRQALKDAGQSGEAGTHSGYARALLADLQRSAAGTPPVGVEGKIWVLDAGVWRGREAADFEVDVAVRFNGHERCERRGDYKDIAQHAYLVAAAGNAEFFESAPVGLACPEGFYRLHPDGSLRLEALHADHRQRYLTAVSPRRGDMPLWSGFLAQTFASANPGEEDEQIALLQELMGAVALGVMARQEKVAKLIGPGRAGKGSVLKVIEHLVPREGHAASSPFRWDNEYYLASLAGKRLNVVGELPEDEPIPAAQFKTVTGRDLLTGRHPSGRPFSFRNEAAHVFSTNHLVATRDHSDAFFSRWLILEFANSRLLQGEEAIDADLAQRIVDAEMPAVLWWALEGAQRLQRRGHFQLTAAHRRVMAAWRRQTDSVLEYLHDDTACELRPDAECARSDFFVGYQAWCSGAGRRAMGKQKTYRHLDSPNFAAVGVSTKRHAEKGWLVKGVALRDVFP